MSTDTNGDLNTNSAHSFTEGAESGATSTDTPRTKVPRLYWYTDNQGRARFCCAVNDVDALERELAAKDMEIKKCCAANRELYLESNERYHRAKAATLRAEKAEAELREEKANSDLLFNAIHGEGGWVMISIQNKNEIARLQMQLDASVCAEQHRQMVAERDQLRADLNDAKDQLDTCMLAKNRLVQDRERLEAELNAARMDTTRLDWLERHHVSARSIKEGWGEDTVLWWQVQDANRSISGHPLPDLRDAIDAARKATP